MKKIFPKSDEEIKAEAFEENNQIKQPNKTLIMWKWIMSLFISKENNTGYKWCNCNWSGEYDGVFCGGCGNPVYHPTNND